MSDVEAPRSLTSVVARGVGFAASGFALTQALMLGFYLVLARLASPDDFGVLAAGSILVGIGTLFAEAGMTSALIQRRDRLEEAASTAVVATLAGGLVLSVVALALAPLIGLYFDRRDVTLVAAAMAGWVFLQAASAVPEALMQRRFSFLRRVVVEPAGAVAFGVTAVIATSQGLGVWGLVLGVYALGATHVVLSWALARWWPSPRLVSFEMWRELMAFGRHVMSAEFVRRIAAELDAALVGRFIGTAPLGQYRYARRFAVQPLTAIVNVTSYVLLPALARVASEETRFRPALLRGLRWTSLAAMPASLVLLPLGEPLAVLLLGEEWREAGQALAALCLYSAGGAVVSVASEAFKAWGRPEVLFRVHVVAAALLTVLMVAFVPFGLIAVAAGVSLASAGAGVYALLNVGRAVGIPFRDLAGEVWPALVAAGMTAVALYPLEHWAVRAGDRGVAEGLALVAAELLAGALCYVALLAAFAPRTALELARATRIASRA